MTAEVSGMGDPPLDVLFDADSYMTAVGRSGFWPIGAERNPLWPRVAEGKS
jgi:hypothetical protein